MPADIIEVEQITKELTKFDTTTAAIALLAEKYMSYTIKGIDDKEGLSLVHAARMDIKNKRVAVTKEGKKLRDGANAFIKRELAVEKEILAQLSPIEDYLSDQENRVQEEIARIKAEVEAKTREVLQARIDQLVSLGCAFNGNEFLYNGAHVASLEEIQRASLENYNMLAEDLQHVIDEEKAIRAEEERLRLEKEAALKKVAEEQEAERKKLEEEKEAFRKKQEAEAAKIRAEQEARENAFKEAQAKMDAERKALEAEKQRLVDEENARLKAIEDEKKRIEQEKLRAIELEKAKAEAAEKALKDAEEKAKKEAELKAKKEAAAARKAARRPDKEKLLAFMEALSLVPYPELKTDDGKAVQKKIGIALGKTLNDAIGWIEEL